ncbi:MAG TPA: hypothetical protein DIU00_24540 [Phycisphaerales bacterium]|mgnify:CR=1 FL=1|nr:hypothetical protein [Phycisphaerales bacterium]
MNEDQDNRNITQNRPGVILLVTLVLLVVLSTLGYTLSSRVSAQRHRNQYIIDYSNARYGCDSAVKYALATLEELNPQLVSRPNEPDFSDLFALDEIGYQELITQWQEESEIDGFNKGKNFDDMSDVDSIIGTDSGRSGIDGFKGPYSMKVRGPYGPSWPFVTEPAEFEIGSAKIRIEIEDENAKYPLGWALLINPEIQREVDAGFQTFCEMMRLDFIQTDSLREQLQEISEIKSFELNFKPITKVVRSPISTKSKTTSKSRTSKTPRPKLIRRTISVSKQISDQTTHFAKLFHSSLIDTEPLAQPFIESEYREEFPLKYIGLWGARQVNINTAPRHVLEAALIFGGNEVEIAEEIIQQRQEEPFENIEGIKERLSRYSDSIGKCEEYITTKSSFFMIRITATSGVAKASSMIAITKQGNRVTRIAVIND